MYFELIDGKPRFALAKTTAKEQAETPDGTQEIEREKYIFSEEELALYPEATPLEQPTPEIMAKARRLEGKTLSRTEFERMLAEPVSMNTEHRLADLEAAVAAIMGGATS